MNNLQEITSKYWYSYYTQLCPVCGKEETTKERVYEKTKPKEHSSRHEYVEIYDYCNS